MPSAEAPPATGVPLGGLPGRIALIAAGRRNTMAAANK